MAEHKGNPHGNNLNDPEQKPADVGDHQQRTDEHREEQRQTGGPQDSQGHTPKLPTSNKPAGNKAP